MDSMQKMLIVDDMEINRLLLGDLFSEEFDIIEAENGREALDALERYGAEIGIVMLDVVMPVLDGFAVLREMNRTGLIGTVPVILVTGEADEEKSLAGYDLGISDLVNKPFNSKIVHRRVLNVVDLYRHKYHLELKLQKQKAILEKQANRLRQSSQFAIDALSAAVEFRDMESGEHIQRIRGLTGLFLKEIKGDYSELNDADIEIISNAAAMHDIGKIAIPDAILLKPGRLTDEEFEIMKTHTTKGCEMLERLNYMLQDQEYYNYCYDICRHHHEKWDGRGYPDGLKGDEISIWAQATSLADVFDALTSKRVYKDAYSAEKAIQMILNGECGAFNPKLLDVLHRVTDKL